jgi:hypothetical protein
MSSKRQTTMAKLARERKVQERRALKQEKRAAAVAERRAKAENPSSEGSAAPQHDPD